MTLDTLAEYERRAQELLAPTVFPGLFAGQGHPVDRANINNVAAFAEVVLRPRVLVDVSRRTLALEVLGQKISLPVMLAPASGHQRFHPAGELASVRAAGLAGTLFAMSTLSGHSIEEVARAATGPIWFQLYVLRDRGLVEMLVQRADKAGFSGLLITVDNKTFHFPGRSGPSSDRPDLEFANFASMQYPQAPTPETWSEGKSQSFNWSDLEWIRSITSLPIVVKGIQTAEDATLCAHYGMDALVVSNHGGWALYGANGTLRSLPEIVDAVGNSLEIYLDGGIRHGTDVLKALALGAKAVFIGRPMIWGLACDGEAGVQSVIEVLRSELDDAMGMCGVTDVKAVDRNVVASHGAEDGQDFTRRLERLVALVDRGFLSRDEFEVAKHRLLHV